MVDCTCVTGVDNTDILLSFQELCEPVGYKPMLHEDHTDDLKHFRIKSKSWNDGKKTKKPRFSRHRSCLAFWNCGQARPRSVVGSLYLRYISLSIPAWAGIRTHFCTHANLEVSTLCCMACGFSPTREVEKKYGAPSALHSRTLNVIAPVKNVADDILKCTFYYYHSVKMKSDISRESSAANRRNHMAVLTASWKMWSAVAAEILVLSTLGKISRWHIEICFFFYFSHKSRIWHLLQFFSIRDNLQEMPDSVFREKVSSICRLLN